MVLALMEQNVVAALTSNVLECWNPVVQAGSLSSPLSPTLNGATKRSFVVRLLKQTHYIVDYPQTSRV